MATGQSTAVAPLAGIVQPEMAKGFTLSREIALFVSPGTIRSLKAGAGLKLTIGTSTNVVTAKANLSNYGSGAGV